VAVKTNPAALVALLGATRTESERTLLELVDERPMLLVFLRHFGCSFCRQAIDDVSQVRGKLADRGVQVAFVHLGSPDRAKPYFDYYKLSDVERVSNPDGSLYREPVFALARVNLLHLIRPAVWMGWLRGAIFKYRVGLLKEDIQQMPGVFFLKDRAIASLLRHRTISYRSKYRGWAPLLDRSFFSASLRPTIPATMRATLIRRGALADSPSSTMPRMTVPTDPMPTQML